MRKKIFLMILIGLAILSAPNTVLAQDSDKVAILSPRVGSVIDARERERYELFQEIKGFDRVVFLQTPAKTYYARVMFVGPDGERRDTTIRYSEDALSVLAEQIDHFEDLKAGKYHMGDQPSKVELAESIRVMPYDLQERIRRHQTLDRLRQLAEERTEPKKSATEGELQRAEGIDVVLVLTSGQEIEGELLSVRDSSVLIAVEDQNVPRALATGVQGILAIKDTMISRVTIEGTSRVFLGIVVGSPIGGGIGALIAGAGKSDEPYVVHFFSSLKKR